jgi:hypothetical protein
MWRGFDLGQTFVALPGLAGTPGATANATWEASDFAADTALLRLLGFNAVALPFTLDDLQGAPQDVAVACPQARPSAADLAARAVAPGQAPSAGLPPPPRLYLPPASNSSDGGGTCNGYVPRGPTTLARLLWTVDYLVRSGLYVALQYSPPASAPALDSPAAFAAAWQRTGVALTCLPGWSDKLAGRVLLGLLADPSAASLAWSGGNGGGGNRNGSSSGSGSGSGSARAPLGEYYLAALDALGTAGGGGTRQVHSLQPLFLVSGDAAGFVTDPAHAKELGAGDAAAFMGAVAAKPYAGRVVLGLRLPGAPAVSAAGPNLWKAYEGGW